MSETLQDEFAGQGGSYVMKDGKRVRVEETVEHPDGHCARGTDGKPHQEHRAPADEVSVPAPGIRNKRAPDGAGAIAETTGS
ncbi:MAG: hypothetical protein ACOY4U_04495 [Pseudomonadota bacterium]